MKKLFEEYGGVITTVIAIVALIGIISLTIAGPNGGWVGGAFSDVIDKFSEKTTIALADGPIMLDGDGQVLNALEPKAFSFRSSAPFEEFKEVRIDGVVVDESNYSVKSGSTIVTFNEEYSEELSTGEHSVEIVSESGSATGDFGVTFALNEGAKIPEGCTYTPNGGTALSAGETMPAVQYGDIYTTADYRYKCMTSYKGWAVEVRDKSKSSYEKILECINGMPIATMGATFEWCTELTTAPEIPSSVTNMNSTFYRCTNLTTAPEIPSSVTNMNGTFRDCTRLTTAPEIPSSVTNMNSTFYGCSNLTTAQEIPSSVTTMNNTFDSCFKLTGEIVINANLTEQPYSCFLDTKKPITLKGSSTMLYELTGTSNAYNVTIDGDWRFHSEGDYNYRYDSSIDGWGVKLNTNVTNKNQTSYGAILESINGKEIKSMYKTFDGCSKLTTAPEIPSSVTDMRYTFYKCTALTGTIVINANPSRYDYCFQSVDFEAQNLKLTGSSTILEAIFKTSYCSACQGTCTQSHGSGGWKDDQGWF